MTPSFEVPVDWTRLTIIHARAAGEPLRVVRGGFPVVPGDPLGEGFLLGETATREGECDVSLEWRPHTRENPATCAAEVHRALIPR